MKTLLKEPLACFVLLLAIICIWLSFEIKWYRDKKAAAVTNTNGVIQGSFVSNGYSGEAFIAYDSLPSNSGDQGFSRPLETDTASERGTGILGNTNGIELWSKAPAWITSHYQIGGHPSNRLLTLRNINRTAKTNSWDSRWLSDFDFTPTNVVVEFELDRLILTTNKGMLEVRFRK